MSIIGSYANGFAPRDGVPINANLWTDNVSSLAPHLGPSGLLVRDWSGAANHGTITNGGSWIPASGYHSVTLDGVNDFIKCGVNTAGNLGTSNATIVVWCVLPNVSAFGNIISKRHGSGVFQQWALLQGYINTSFAGVSGKMVSLFWYSGGAVASNQHVYTTADVADGGLHCIVARRIAGTTPTIWVDGVQRASTTVGTSTSNINADSTTDPIRIGAASDAAGYLGFNFIESQVFERALTDSEIRSITQPGLAYIRRRRRSMTFAGGFKAYWAARKALIQMAGSN